MVKKAGTTVTAFCTTLVNMALSSSKNAAMDTEIPIPIDHLDSPMVKEQIGKPKADMNQAGEEVNQAPRPHYI